ncbi:MAG TPA: CBS domain-containing protein [Anaeromyxobacteraceae bacterium]|jgi:acetoin utilization protein AcuB|nr:CBS domain-containing protein [Anaeromyxobacteraceae bacterium]
MDSKTAVGSWMTPNPVTIDADASIVEAIHTLKEKNVRRLPVMRGGKVAGVITEKMLLSYTPSKATSLDHWEVQYLLGKTPVSEAMNPSPHTVKPDADITEAARLLHDRKLNGVLVVDDAGALVGIFTTTNALEALVAFAQECAARH